MGDNYADLFQSNLKLDPSDMCDNLEFATPKSSFFTTRFEMSYKMSASPTNFALVKLIATQNRRFSTSMKFRISLSALAILWVSALVNTFPINFL